MPGAGRSPGIHADSGPAAELPSHRRVVAASPDPAYLYEPDGWRVRAANPRLLDALGIAPPLGPDAEADPSLFSDRIESDEIPSTREVDARLVASDPGAVVEREWRLRHADGSIRRLVAREVVVDRDAAGRPRLVLGTARDETDRLAAEETLRASEARYRTIVSASSSIIWTAHTDGSPVDPDRSWEAFTGQPLSEYWGTGWLEMVHPEDRDRAIEAWARALRDRAGYTVEFRLRRRDGAYRRMVDRGMPVFGERGEILEWVGTCVDETEARETEASLREAEERLAIAAGAARLGTWDYNPGTGSLEWDARCREMFGLAADVPVNYPGFLARLHPDDRDRVDRAVARALDPTGGGEIHEVYRIAGPPSVIDRWIAADGRAFFDRDGRPARFVGTVIDVTERKRSAAALAASERRYRALIEVSPQVVWSARPDGGISFVNGRWLDYAGQSEAEALRGGQGWADVLPPDRREATLAAWRAVARRRSTVAAEVPLRRASDGSYRWHLINGRSTRDESGRVVAWIGTAVDIHDRKVAEGALREADRRKDEFLAMLAHELRNPLSAIANAAALARLSDGAEPDALERGREITERQVRHLARLVDDLLDVSRINLGKIQLRRERLDAARVVTQAVEAVRPLVLERKQALDVTLGAGPFVVEADPTRLEQILVNLLTNAAKYTDEGGSIALEARREPRPGADGDALVFRVRDTGIGLTAETLARIFDLFAQVDHSLARSRGGLGIGLTLVRTLAEMHGGTITARSDGPGLGSEFVVTLPAADPALAIGEANRDRAAVAGASPAGPRRVLVVDDNEDTAWGMSRLLRLAGHEVRVAHDGDAAIALAAEVSPDVVLLDIGLPGKDGYEVVAALRVRPELARTVFLAVSGYGQAQDVARSVESGFHHHLVKPVDFDVLIPLVEGRPPG